MKRRILAALLAAMLLLGGCGGKQNDAPARKADSDMIIITENYAEDGHYTDSLDNSWTYSYHVPQLTADTAGARAINAAIDVISACLAEGDKVQLVGFGAFEVKSRAERIGRNPKTKESIKIPASKVPVFKPGKALKDVVAK